MSKEEKEHLDHPQPATRTKRRKDDKMNRILNYLIGIVSVLIVISLIVIFTGNEDEEIAEEEPAEEAPADTKPVEENEEEENEETDPQSSMQEEEPIGEESTETESSDPIVSSSDQPAVDEVWTNESWEPYPTQQTGEHTSTFTEGHIDYEEKLSAIYSVIPLEQQDSILWSIKNNGNAKSAIAVISSNDKEQKYRVAIEWIEGQGWMPQQVEVLNTLEGTY
jgi:cytoskeletal protein RodZ